MKKSKIQQKNMGDTQYYSLDLFQNLPIKKYNLILCDPPWEYKNKNYHGVPLQYSSLSLRQLQLLPVQSMLQRDSIFLLWSTSVHLETSFKLLAAWGLQYVTLLFVYNKKSKNSEKLQLGFGYYTRGQCEYLLMAKTGVVSQYLQNQHNIGQKIQWGTPEQFIDKIALEQPYQEWDVTLPRLQYQQKPKEFYQLLGQIFKLEDMECLELFSRRRNDNIFDLWGNEIQDGYQQKQGNDNKEGLLVYETLEGEQREFPELPIEELQKQVDGVEGVIKPYMECAGVIMDGFEAFTTEKMLESEELQRKYGRFAQETWKQDYQLNLRKMGSLQVQITVKSIEEQFLQMISTRLQYLAITKEELTPADVEPFKIELTNTEPSYEKPMRYNKKLMEFIDKEIQSLMDKGLIYKSNSSWAAKIVMAPKGESWRMCMNYVGINSKTKPDRYPLPNIEDLHTWLAGKTVFSILDLLSGYWQIPLHWSTQQYTAFITQKGLYQFKVLPFGLRNAPSHFQRVLNTVLRPLIGTVCLVYIDDVIVFSDNEEQHLEHVRQVLDLLNGVKLQINLPKCKFFQEKVKFLGMIVRQGQITVDMEKIRRIAELTTPKTIKQIRGFLGMCGYYRKYIKNFARIASPLIELTKYSSEQVQTEECGRAFEQLKQKLLAEPILALPNQQDPFILAVDFSYSGFGMVFSQIQAGKEKVIGYYSKTLSESERKYAATEGECACIVWAISKVRQYIVGSKFYVVTDHKALLWLLQTKQQNAKLSRWAALISQYDFNIIYREGKQHTNADFMSRGFPESKEGQEQEVVGYILQETLNNATCEICREGDREYQQIICDQCNKVFHSYCLGIQELPILYWYCSTCNHAIQFKKIDETQDIPFLESVRQQTEIAGHQGQKYQWADNRLFIFKEKYYVEFPPVAKRMLLIEQVHHDYCHLGAQKLAKRLSAEYYWPQLEIDCIKYVQCCIPCQLQQVKFRDPENLKNIHIGIQPRQLYAIDLIPDIKPRSKQNNTQIVVVVDSFSKFVVLGALPNRTSETLASWFYKNIIGYFGVPYMIRSDGGSEFMSAFEEMCHQLEIKHHVTLSHHPQGNGQAERFVRTVKQYLIRALVESRQDIWEDILPTIQQAINTTVATAHGYTPFQLQYGTQSESILREYNEKYIIETGSEVAFYNHISRQVVAYFRDVWDKQQKYKERMRQYYDNQRNKKPRQYQFQEGQLVMLRNFQKKRLATNAVGPFQVVKVFPRSAVVRPLIRIQGEYREKQFNLKDLAPMAIEDDATYEEEKKRARQRLEE